MLKEEGHREKSREEVGGNRGKCGEGRMRYRKEWRATYKIEKRVERKGLLREKSGEERFIERKERRRKVH